VATPLAAQAPPDWQKAAGGRMSFEVASVRPSAPGVFTPPNFSLDRGDSTIPPGGLLTASMPLEVYIEFAYKIKLSDEQIDVMFAGQPKWASTDRFTVHARAAGNPTKDQMRLMMQSLLKERFKLALHFENKEVPAFLLTLAKPGKLGPKLRPHSEGPPCDGLATPDMFPPSCNGAGSSVKTGPAGLLYMVGARDANMAVVGDALAWEGKLERPVVDRTGLNGNFDFALEFSPGPPSGQSEPQGPTFMDAVNEELGLNLKASKALLDVPVIDHIELPSDN